MAATQPTILVKKADGTSVRVSLAEFKKMRAAVSSVPSPDAKGPDTKPAESVLPKPTPPLLTDPTEEELPAVAAEVKPVASGPTSVPAPVLVSAPVLASVSASAPLPPALPKPQFKPRPPVPPPAPKVVEKPLLDETVAAHEVRDAGVAALPSVLTDTVVRDIIRESKLVVANDLWGRTQSLILSWLRGIRADEQFMQYATAPVEKGGLGISASTAAVLIKVMQKYKKNVDEVPVKISPRAAVSAPPAAPVPKNTAPVAMKAPAPIVPVPDASATMPGPLPAPISPGAPARPAPLPASAQSVVQDVKHDASAQPTQPARSAQPTRLATAATTPLTGPAEEMSTFTMADWRRLGATPDAAQVALLAKFAGWRGESFLLFMDAFTAWQSSPVMQQYRDIAVTAINERRPVSAVITNLAADRLSPNLAEFMAINKVNHELAI